MESFNKNDLAVNIANDTELVQPRFKEIVILNDDYTTMNFVTTLLVNVFDKSITDANNIMMHVHNKGEGVCGIYPYDIAELKYSIANEMIFKSQEPLRIILRDV